MVKLWLKDYHVVTLTAIQMGNRSPSWYQDGCSIPSNLSFYHFLPIEVINLFPFQHLNMK